MTKLEKHKLTKTTYEISIKKIDWQIIERYAGWFSIHENGRNIGTALNLKAAIRVVEIHSGSNKKLKINDFAKIEGLKK